MVRESYFYSNIIKNENTSNLQRFLMTTLRQMFTVAIIYYF